MLPTGISAISTGTGRGVPRDDATAFSYYARVAEAYDPDERDQNRLRIMVDAQLRVADYYRVGIADAGIKANHKVAARSYLKIASTYGHPGAQYSLGLMNIKGQGVKKKSAAGVEMADRCGPKAPCPVGSLSRRSLLGWQARAAGPDPRPDVVHPRPAVHQAIGVPVDI